MSNATKKQPKRQRVNFRLPHELVRRARAEAGKRGQTFTTLTERALSAALALKA